jgi:hypothetical protein
VLVEVAVGTSGYFANFKDPLGVIGIALLDGLRVRRFGHWLALGALTVLTFVVFVLWTGVKHDLRREARYSGVAFGFEDRVNRFQNAAEKWIDRGPELWVRSTDQLMSRLWPVYYPALAMRRVPASRPHESGALMRGAIEFTLKPRLLFPDKPTLDDADSNMVRQYAGVFVAGDREQTSIAFGHIGESYVDFGVPGVVVYELLFGVFLGLVMATLGAYIRNPELAAGITVVTGLLAPSAASWTKILGGTVHMAVALGAVGVMLSALLARRRAQQVAADPDARALSTDA